VRVGAGPVIDRDYKITAITSNEFCPFCGGPRGTLAEFHIAYSFKGPGDVVRRTHMRLCGVHAQSFAERHGLTLPARLTGS
jgi:hypothetical protein